MNNEKILFAGTKYKLFDKYRPAGFSAPDYRIPSIICSGANVIAAIDSASGGMDWGKIAISVKISRDCGETWSDEIRVFTPPSGKAVIENDETTSAIAMDPVMVNFGERIIMLYDMFPESKGLHDRSRIELTDGFCDINGKKYLMLFSKEQNVKNLKKKKTKTGFNCYTLRDDGYVYDPDGNKTNYYSPLKHSFQAGYETIGDLYYGNGEFLNEEPPLYPVDTADVYVGNIYLNSDMPNLTDSPERVIKTRYNGIYDTPETKAAPLRAAVCPYLWQSDSTDGGLTWSQPRNIMYQVKNKRDRKFFGTGPGIGITLQRQNDKSKNGRVLIPVYALGKSAVIYSDDGFNWKRHSSLYSRNIDETQLVETCGGSVLCFGRQKKYGKTPLSVSTDGGESYKKNKSAALYSVRCQKSVLMLPHNSENGFEYADYMDIDKEYLVSVHPTGHNGKDSSRTDGVLSVCSVENEYVATVKDIPLKDSGFYAEFGKESDFFAYSSVTLLPDNTLGILYEIYPSGCIAFKKIKL